MHLGWDQRLIDEILEHIERQDVHIDDAVVTNIVRLAQYFLADFVPHGQVQWLAMEDKLVLARLALRAIDGLTAAVERNPNNVNLPDDAMNAMIHAMLGFNASVCTWHDTLQEEARTVVAQLYTETSNRIVFFLRVLGGRFSTDLPAAHHISRIRNLFCGTLQVASSASAVLLLCAFL